MHHGVCMFATEYAIRIDELARECESRGFESLWVPEHTHIPTSRRSPFAGGQPLPEQYKHTLDPFVALMAAAAATKNLRVGTGICLLIERDTITTAKAVASLDAYVNLAPVPGGTTAESMTTDGTAGTGEARVYVIVNEVPSGTWGVDGKVWPTVFTAEAISIDPERVKRMAAAIESRPRLDVPIN